MAHFKYLVIWSTFQKGTRNNAFLLHRIMRKGEEFECQSSCIEYNFLTISNIKFHRHQSKQRVQQQHMHKHSSCSKQNACWVAEKRGWSKKWIIMWHEKENIKAQKIWLLKLLKLDIQQHAVSIHSPKLSHTQTSKISQVYIMMRKCVSYGF